LGKGCVFYGQFFIPDYPIRERQKACAREVFKRAREEIEGLEKETV
jgi:hypothetical protein